MWGGNPRWLAPRAPHSPIAMLPMRLRSAITLLCGVGAAKPFTDCLKALGKSSRNESTCSRVRTVHFQGQAPNEIGSRFEACRSSLLGQPPPARWRARSRPRENLSAGRRYAAPAILGHELNYTCARSQPAKRSGGAVAGGAPRTPSRSAPSAGGIRRQRCPGRASPARDVATPPDLGMTQV